jgi:acetamidase/formamidase/creatinine amidohydrolase/Fe(II)-dependent formamide hydrolase-like protein
MSLRKLRVVSRHAMALSLVGAACVARAETHRLEASVGHATFAVRPPVLTVRPGDVVESATLWGDWYEREGGRWPGEVGPIAVAGAEPGDTLVVEILKVRPNRDSAVSTQGRSFGALVPDAGTAMLNPPFPRGRFVWRLDRQRMTGALELPRSALGAVSVPLRPMLGRVAVAPEGEEAFGGLWPGPFGGNMDAAEVREGTTVYLPVFHPGALFYFGDGHALQGDAEVCGSGLETSMDVAFRFGLLKGKRIDWPRLEDAENIMVAGSARPLTDALRIAFVELIRWLEVEHGFERAEAYQLTSQVASVRVANAVDPLYTVVARFPKRYLPARTVAAASPGLRLGDVPWTEAEAYLTRDRVVVLPLGAGSKEHGPHLPLRNDEILAEYFARRLLAARPVALLPILSYGFYPAFLEYPGSVSLSFETQRDAIAEICRSIARHGPRRFYVLNTGISTLRPLEATAELLAGEGILLGYTDLGRLRKVEDAVRQQRFGTHADELETSMILYMQPGVVRMEKAVADGRPEGKGLTRDPRNAEGSYSPSGVFGDATLATWQKGEAIVEDRLRAMLEEIDALARATLPSGDPRSPLERDPTPGIR